MGCARRACRVSLNPSTRRSPRAWAWAYLSAARSSKSTADGCGRSRANRRVLSFSLRSPPPERTDRDRVDVAPGETDLARCPIESVVGSKAEVGGTGFDQGDARQCAFLRGGNVDRLG